MLKERKRIQLNTLLVEKNYLIIYGLFFGSLILASFFSETKTATSNTLKFFTGLCLFGWFTLAVFSFLCINFGALQ